MTQTFNPSQPIYRQLMEQFYKQICSGQLMPGDKLPSVRETAVEVGVNPNTVQRTYMEMEREGVLITKRGQGSFVTEDQRILKQLRRDMAEERLQDFIQFMLELGFNNDEILQQVDEKLTSKRGEDESEQSNC